MTIDGNQVRARIVAPDLTPPTDAVVAFVKGVFDERLAFVMERIDWDQWHRVVGFAVIVDHREYNVVVRCDDGLTPGMLSELAERYPKEGVA